MSTVDVIIPAYNAARFLPAALDSVIAQTFTDWQILLINDGSQDSTPAIAQAYAERLGSKLRYVSQENAGLPAARNAAIRHGDAPFLALLDADDVWLPNRLGASLKAFEGKPDVGLAYGFVERIDAEGHVLDVFAKRSKYGEGFIAKHIYRREIDLPCPTVTFRRESIEQVGLFDKALKATEDRDLWLRIAQRYRVALVPQIIAQYRVSSAAMTTDTERMLRAQTRFIEKHYGSEGCGFWSRRVALSWAYRQRAEALFGKAGAGPALRSAWQAIQFDPFQIKNFRTAGSLLLRSVNVQRRAGAAASSPKRS